MYFTNSEINKLFGMKKTPRTLIKAEEEGRIPRAERVQRGKVSIRQWQVSSLPKIGEKYGFLKQPTEQRIMSVFVAKGGVLKTTIAYNLARALSLHNIKTLIIGIDVQESITTLTLGKKEITNLNDLEKRNGLYELIKGHASLEDVLCKTDIPTLSIIPENSNLALLDQEVTKSPRMVDVFRDNLLPLLNDYEVIIFDSGPNFNNLTKNILTVSNHIIAPIACEIGTYQALEQNLEILNSFKKEAKLEWETYQMIPTLLDNNNLSKQIQGAFISQFTDTITNVSIKRTTKGQEASAIQKSIFEHMPNSDLSHDYRNLFIEIWEKINREVH